MSANSTVRASANLATRQCAGADTPFDSVGGQGKRAIIGFKGATAIADATQQVGAGRVVNDKIG